MSVPVEAIAAEVAEALATGRQIAPIAARYPGFGIGEGYAVAAELRRLRQAGGETHVGRKIGFTNRTIWKQYDVDAPMWGDMYDTTVADIGRTATFALKGFPEPQIEPEIVFGIASAPSAGMDQRALLGCVGWIAHGCEIVQTIFPGWKFALVDTIAGNGLHAALLIGPRHPTAERSADEWQRALSSFEIALHRDGAPVDRGQADFVLGGGPLTALAHLVGLLDRDPHNPPLRAGEIVTTGTVTRAHPIAAGETWSTALTGLALDPLAVTFT